MGRADQEAQPEGRVMAGKTHVAYPGRSAAPLGGALQTRDHIERCLCDRPGSEMYRSARAARRTASGIQVILSLLAIVLLTGDPALAQDYPTRPIMLVVPFPAGGGNDALARAVAERMTRTLGQQVVVENRAAGGGGTVATRAISKAPPDGYTILLTYTGTLAVNPTLYPNAGYDPRKDFAPIGLIGSQPSVLTVHPSLPLARRRSLSLTRRPIPARSTPASCPAPSVT